MPTVWFDHFYLSIFSLVNSFKQNVWVSPSISYQFCTDLFHHGKFHNLTNHNLKSVKTELKEEMNEQHVCFSVKVIVESGFDDLDDAPLVADFAQK